LTFESGSALRQIDEFAFSGCSSLDSICIPASVKLIDASSFPPNGTMTTTSGFFLLKIFFAVLVSLCLIQLFCMS
jgi:hypothetical protein